MPVVVPGAAVSPGDNTCSFAKAPGFTVMPGLMPADLVLSVRLLAVIVEVEVVFNVTLKVRLPLMSAEFAGNAALLSEEVRPIVSVILLTMFQ